MERGYVKLWRKSLDSSIFTNPKIWFFWTYCLMKATHKKYKTTEGFQHIELEPGQFIFGRKKASEETGLSEQNIRTCLKFLEKSKNLTIKPTNKFSIISITNWVTYQPKEEDSNQHSNQQVTNNQPTSNQQVTTNKNNKHIKNIEKEKKKIKKKSFSDDIYSFVDDFSKYISDANSKIEKADVEKSADTVDKLIRLDNNSLEYIRKVLQWAVKDDFWSGVIFSLIPLRAKSKNTLTKFQNIANGYEKKNGQNNNFSEVVYEGTKPEDISWI